MLFVRASHPAAAGAAIAAPAGTSASPATAAVAIAAVLTRLESVADGYIVFPSVRVSSSTPVLGEPKRTPGTWGSPSSQMPTVAHECCVVALPRWLDSP